MITCGKKIISENKHTQSTEHEVQTESSKELPSSPQKKKGGVTAASQGGAFSILPPGSNCLFCSLNVLSLRFSGVAAVLFSRSSTLSIVGDEIFPFLLESTPAVKKPLAVIRPVSHTPSFGGHCCPGVSRPVPADDDSSFSNSGPISSSSFSKLKCIPDGGSEVCEMGLQCYMVSTGVTVICACASSQLRLSTYRLIPGSSSSGSLP